MVSQILSPSGSIIGLDTSDHPLNVPLTYTAVKGSVYSFISTDRVISPIEGMQEIHAFQHTVPTSTLAPATSTIRLVKPSVVIVQELPSVRAS